MPSNFLKRLICLGLAALLSLTSFIPTPAASYQDLTPLETNNSKLKLQIHSASTRVNLDSDPELRFRIRLAESITGSIGIKLYKSSGGERGRLVSMRKPRIPSKAKSIIVDMPLNEITELSEIIIELLSSSGTLINSYTTTITATSEVTEEADIFGGIESSAVSSDIFVKESGNVYADNLETADHFIFGSNQVDNAEGTSDDAKLMFLRGSKEGAFRAGLVTTTAWDLSNIGTASVALGTNTKASGDYSVSIGHTNQATNQSSIALGTNAIASGIHSLAMGNNVSATDDYSMVIGSGNSAEDPLNSAGTGLSIGFNSNTATLFVSSSAGTNTTGRVGIGTETPHADVKLDVAGPLRLRQQADLPTCNSAAKGIIIFYNNTFRGCNGSGWQWLN